MALCITIEHLAAVHSVLLLLSCFHDLVFRQARKIYGFCIQREEKKTEIDKSRINRTRMRRNKAVAKHVEALRDRIVKKNDRQKCEIEI